MIRPFWFSQRLLFLVGLTVTLTLPAAGAPLSIDVMDRERADGSGSEFDRALATLEAKQRTVVSDLEKARAQSSVHGRVYTRLARTGLLALTGGFSSLVTHAMRLEASKRALVHDAATLQTLELERQNLATTRESLIAKRNLLWADRSPPPEAEPSAAGTDESASRLSRFEHAAGATSRLSHGTITVYGATEPEAATPATFNRRRGAVGSAGFAALRGRLLFPVAGRTEVTPARRESANGPGVELRASPHTPVRAVAAGRVAFRAEYGDYGLMVILDHGDHYFTVTANLSDVEVHVGDDVSAGAPLGQTSSGPLYFEVRHASETIDPRPWLGT